MTDESIEKLFSALDGTFKPYGYDRFDLAIGLFADFFRQIADATALMRNRDEVRAWLLTIPEPEPAQLDGALKLLSGLVYTIRQVAPNVVKNMPHPVGGHPFATTHEQNQQICMDVKQMYENGIRRSIVYQRIAQRYGVSVRTVQRIWKERAALQ